MGPQLRELRSTEAELDHMYQALDFVPFPNEFENHDFAIVTVLVSAGDNELTIVGLRLDHCKRGSINTHPHLYRRASRD